MWILEKEEGRAWTGFIFLSIGTSKCGNEISGSITCGEFLDWLRN
jgi:hypothetical protein